MTVVEGIRTLGQLAEVSPETEVALTLITPVNFVPPQIGKPPAETAKADKTKRGRRSSKKTPESAPTPQPGTSGQNKPSDPKERRAAALTDLKKLYDLGMSQDDAVAMLVSEYGMEKKAALKSVVAISEKKGWKWAEKPTKDSLALDGAFDVLEGMEKV